MSLLFLILWLCTDFAYDGLAISSEKGMVLNPYITWAFDSGELKGKVWRTDLPVPVELLGSLKSKLYMQVPWHMFTSV